MLTLGASLVQICTGLVYHGPGLVKSMKRELLALMDRHGVSDVGTLIGNAALAEIDPLHEAQQLARAAA
jgi:dihydroorotate dehydrogenase